MEHHLVEGAGCLTVGEVAVRTKRKLKDKEDIFNKVDDEEYEQEEVSLVQFPATHKSRNKKMTATQ